MLQRVAIRSCSARWKRSSISIGRSSPIRPRGPFFRSRNLRKRFVFFGAAHPFRVPGHIPEQPREALAAFQFVDLNGKDLAHDFEGTIAKTYAFAQELGVPVVSGSDTHQAFQYGCAVTVMGERVTTVAGLRAQVLSGNYRISYASDLAFKVKTAGMLKRALKEIDRLGGDYVQTLIAGAE